jgi:hypothetical protein
MFLASRVKTPFYMAHRVMAPERPTSSMRGRAIAKTSFIKKASMLTH